MAADDIVTNSVFDYIAKVKEIIDKLGMRDNEILLFRGHSDKKYKLIPSLFRKDNEKIRDREAESIRQIEIEYPRELAGMSTLDKLVMLQHYEFPTRLLDFSFNPLVALFFAANSHSHKEDNGAVIICRVARDKIMPFDSNIVKALAELAVFPKDLKDKLSKYKRKQLSLALSHFLSMGEDVYAEMLDEEPPEKKLADLARRAMYLMPPEVNGKLDLFKTVFVKTKLLNPRIVAQKGAFLLFGLSNEFPKSIKCEKIIIPAEHKAAIMKELEQFGIYDSIMFPGFEHFLLSLREKMKHGE